MALQAGAAFHAEIMKIEETIEVGVFYEGVKQILDTFDHPHGSVDGCKYDVYLFYDYDDEPIYTG